MLARKWLFGTLLSLIALGCATGVEEEPPPGDVTDDGGPGDPSGDGGAGDGGATGCPTGMVKIPAGADTYCIDATEVTNEAYAKFLATKPSTASQPSACSWNDSFEPGTFPAASGEEKHPVVEVDWCDARAYCAWAGKRLCGRIGAGELLRDAHDDAKKSQWFNACSQGGARKFPYGGEYDPSACNGLGHDANEPVAVASLKSCEGGSGGLFDMSGNVLEWEDSCDGASGRADSCLLRGGSYQSDLTSLQCAHREQAARGQGYPTVGFRCCRD